jgi:CTP:molybdopterin cytidylyltransferase MocA
MITPSTKWDTASSLTFPEKRACGGTAHGAVKQVPVTIVILAAGQAARMGRQKLLLPIDGSTLIERAVAAAAPWPTVVVAGAEVAAALAQAGVRVLANDAPERGMRHSLALADALIDPSETLAVLPADLPDCDHAALARVIDAYDPTVDVVFPRRGARAGHPVIFGPRARAKIGTLADGDTLRLLRDDPTLRRRTVEVEGDAAFTDIDTPADYAARIQRLK